MKSSIIFYFLYFFSFSTLTIIIFNDSYRILLLVKYNKVIGKIESCDSLNTSMGMSYTYTGSFTVRNKIYSFRKSPSNDKIYKIGGIILIRYNPENPNKNIVDRFYEKYYILYSISLMLMIFFISFFLHRRFLKCQKLVSQNK